jgi:hypothetical protein
MALVSGTALFRRYSRVGVWHQRIARRIYHENKKIGVRLKAISMTIP